MAIRRLPRWIGIGLIWTILFVAAWVMTFLTFVAAPVVGILLILVLIPLGIYGWPYFTLAPVALVLGPTDDPPARRTIATMRGRWGSIAGRIFLLNLTLIVGLYFK